jgi:putative addiction module antidote
MGSVVKVTAVGDALGIVLPREALAKLGVEEGDSLYLTEAANGVEISPYDEELGRKVEIGKRVVRKYRDAPRDLTR